MTAIRLALCQLRPTKGSLRDNLAQVERAMRSAADSTEPPDLLLFAEAMLSGYFLEGGVREHALTSDQVVNALGEIHRRASAPPLELCIGCYESWENRLYNSAMWLSLGGEDAGLRHVHRKVFLPTYGVFDEERFVEAGRDVRAFDSRFGRVAMLVCEDAWHSITATIAAVDGAQLIVVPAASPARGLVPVPEHPGLPNSLVVWDRVAQQIAGEHGVFVALAQLTGFEGGKGFPGGSITVSPSGSVIARAPLFDDAIVAVNIDLDEVARVRADSPLLADLELRLPHLIEALDSRRRESVDRIAGQHFGETANKEDKGTSTRRAREASTQRDVETATPVDIATRLDIDPQLTRKWLVEFLRDEVRRQRGFERVIIGMSGGIDSAVVAFLATEAFGAENVIGVRMPYRTSSADSLQHAEQVIAQLGIRSRLVEITAAVDGYAAACGDAPSPERLGNVMARIRMVTLFDLGAATNALPLGTGNKSERLLGYFTWHGDDAPPVNPLGDLFKTQVRQLAKGLGVPAAIIDKPASADLIAGQTDESDVGITYQRADPLLELLLRGYRDDSIINAGFTEAELKLVRGRLDRTHWKRRLPSVAMVSQTAIGEYYLRPLDY